MAKPSLTPAEIAELFTYNPETGDLFWKVKPCDRIMVGQRAGTLNGMGYYQVRYKQKIYLVHRVAWAITHGEWPPQLLDHENRVRSDNRIGNLRPFTQSQNMHNATVSKRNSSGAMGVDWHKKSGKWRASICVEGDHRYLGIFTNKDDAIAARKQAESELFTHAIA